MERENSSEIQTSVPPNAPGGGTERGECTHLPPWLDWGGGSLGYTTAQLTQHFRRHNLLEATVIATLISQMRSRIRDAKY